MENKPRYRLVKRNPNNKDTTSSKTNQNEELNPIINIPELITRIKRSLYSDIDARAKYWMEQRIGLLLNNNALMKKNTTELKIDYDNNSGGLSWLFKYNGSTVAYIDSRGFLYCSNILLNGVNLLNAINNIISINSTLSNLSDIFVRHVDLKNGSYKLNVKDTVTDTLDANTGTIDNLTSDYVTVNNDLTVNGISYLNTLYVQPDSNNVLEYPSRQYTNRGLFIKTNGARTIGYSFFYPYMANGGYVQGLHVGKDLGTGNWGCIRWYHSANNNANNFISVSAKEGYDTLRCKQDGTAYIRSPSNNTTPLRIQYEGNMSNNNYQRICVGDNRDLASYAYGREGSANYAYMKLNGRTCEIRVYDTYMNVSGSAAHSIRTSRTSGAIAYFLEESLANNSTCAIVVGQATAQNNSSTLTYRRATTPLLGLGFYNNDELLTLDPSGNCNIKASLTAKDATLASTSVTDLHSAGNATIDGSVLCTQLDIANSTKNDWYLKCRVEDYLSNGDYIRMILKDLSGQANIDLTHDSQYYGLKLQVPTDNSNDNKLCIWPTGVTIDGQLDAYNDVNIWENLEVGKNITMTNNYRLYTNYIYPIPNTGDTIYMNGRIYDTDGSIIILDNNITTGSWKTLFTIGKWYGTNNVALGYYYDENDSSLCGWRLSYTNGGNLISGDSSATTVYTPTVKHIANASNVTEYIGKDVSNCMTILHTIDYNTNPVTFKLTRYNQAETDMLKLYNTTVEIPNSISLRLDSTSISTVAKSTDVNDSTKVNDNTVATTAYINAKCGDYSVTPATVDTLVWSNTTSPVLQSLTINAIAYGNGMYVCVGNTNDMPYSTDGITWTSNPVAGASGNHKCIAYGNGMFVSPIWGTNYCYTSYDGVTWNKITLPATRNWNAIGYGNGKFIILSGSENAAYSNDGVTWYGQNMGLTSGTYNWTSIVCNGDIWVATRDNSSQIYYSTSGNVWNAASTNVYTSNWMSCAYGNGIWVAVAIDIGYDDYITSTDGIHWTKRTFNGADYNSIAFGGGWFVAVTDEGYTAMSKDGLSWMYTHWHEHSYKSITYCKDKFVTPNAESTVGTVYYTTTNLYPQPTYSNSLDTLSQMIIGRIYPVGSIYVSMTPVNPSTIFGFGTWKQIKNRFLYCNDGNADGVAGGGSATHTISMNELPYRWWQFNALNDHGGQNVTITDYLSYLVNPADYYGIRYSYTGWGYGNPNGPDAFNTMPPYIQVYAWHRTA